MFIFLLSFSITLNVGLVYLLIRASRRLLEFDDIWSGILPVLVDYAVDLRQMSSGDLLLDNPEVVKFHKRNLNALATIESIAQQVAEIKPLPPKRDTNLPRPDVE